MDFQLTEEQVIIQDSARRMVQDDILPILVSNNQDTPLPLSEMLKIYGILARQGLTAPRIPVDAGGGGLSMLNYGLIFEQLPPVIAFSLLAHEVTLTRIFADSEEEQRNRFLPDAIAGKVICCTATSEPGLGSDPRGVTTTVRPDGKSVVINGTKTWITNGTVSNTMIVTCSTGQVGKKNILQRVVVQRESSPFEARDINCLGLRQGHLSELFFDDCLVPKENALGKGDDAARILTITWNGSRPLLGLSAVYLAERAFELAREYAGVRKQFGKLIGGTQLIQNNLVEIATLIETSRLLCYRALSVIDSGGRANGTSAMAKRYAVDACLNAVSLAIKVYGAMGITREAGLEQLFRDVRMLAVPDGTNEILTLIAGRELTGVDAIR